MSDLNGEHPHDSYDDYTLQWLNNDGTGIPKVGAAAPNDVNQTGLAACLYDHCLRALQHIYRQERSREAPRKHCATCLRECFGKLFLWGDSLMTRDLDKALAQCDDLNRSILTQLLDIGRLLLRGNYTLYAALLLLSQADQC